MLRTIDNDNILIFHIKCTVISMNMMHWNCRHVLFIAKNRAVWMRHWVKNWNMPERNEPYFATQRHPGLCGMEMRNLLRKLFGIMLIQTEIRLYLFTIFRLIWIQINWNMLNAIGFRFELTRFQKVFSVCSMATELRLFADELTH